MAADERAPSSAGPGEATEVESGADGEAGDELAGGAWVLVDAASDDLAAAAAAAAPAAAAAAETAELPAEVTVDSATPRGEPAEQPDSQAPAPAAALECPLSWAERALQASAGSGHHASSSSTAIAHPRVAELQDVKLEKDTIIDYLIFLAERQKRSAEANGDEGSLEVPEQLKKFEGCLDAGVATSAMVTYTRLGLTNNANNCYVSVVVQSLLPCNALLWVLRRCNATDPRRPVLSCLVSLCKEFHTRKPESHGDVLNLLVQPQVKDIVASWHKLGAQQDAGEFLYWLLSQMHDESKWKVHVPAEDAEVAEPAAGEAGEDAAAAPSAWAHVVRTSRRAVETRSAGLHEDSPITRIFGGLIQSAVRSRGAKVDSVSLEPFNHLDLDISAQSVVSVRTALEAFCSAEEVNDGQATRRIQFKVLPKVLILNLKRFSYIKGKGGPQKVKKAIKYDEKLILDKAWLAEDVQLLEYFVTAVICHHGESVNRGHYTAIVRYNSEWYMYDDTVVRRVEPKEVAAQQYTAYVLVYQSRGVVDMTP